MDFELSAGILAAGPAQQSLLPLLLGLLASLQASDFRPACDGSSASEHRQTIAATIRCWERCAASRRGPVVPVLGALRLGDRSAAEVLRRLLRRVLE